MQWSDEPHGGFTKQDNQHAGDQRRTLRFRAYQCRDPAAHPKSLLNWTERIIRMRKEVPEIGWGDFAVIPTRNPAVLVMRYAWRNNSVLFVHNFDAKPHEIASLSGLRMSAATAHQFADRGAQSGRRQRPTRLVLEGYGYRWYRVGGLDYLLRRTDIG